MSSQMLEGVVLLDSDVKPEEDAAIAEEVMNRCAYVNLTNCTLNFTFGQ